jgi:outer membrane protein, heavy metal efflux system
MGVAGDGSRALPRGVGIPVLLAVVLLVATGAAAQAPAEPPLDLESCIAEALESNPLVLQWQAEHRAALARASQARALPQPSVAYDSDLQPRPFRFDQSDESYLGVVQLIEFPGKRAVRGRIASAEANQTLADLEMVRLDLAYEVTEAFYSLLLGRERRGRA